MNKIIIMFGVTILLICVGLSGCIDSIPSTSDGGTCCILAIIGVVFFILLIAYLLGGKKTVIHTHQSASSLPPVVIHKETAPEKSESDRRCPSCGRVIPFDANICPYCGKKFIEHIKEEKEEDKPIFCTECGEKLTEKVDFCTKCGAKVIKNE